MVFDERSRSFQGVQWRRIACERERKMVHRTPWQQNRMALERQRLNKMTGSQCHRFHGTCNAMTDSAIASMGHAML
eukprot:1160662-Pelagomonas_calceolata.AAC.7